jgi:UDP-glucose 4-epimerase
MNLKDIIITGGTGFIGRNIKNRLEKRYNIKDISKSNGGDIRNSETFLNINSDLVIHLAAINRSDNLKEMFETNVNGTLNVLEFCRKNKTKLIFASSAAIYGNCSPPAKEEYKTNPVSFYGLTKLFGEELCEFYNKIFGLDITILRIFNIYGPNQKEGLLIPDILSKIKNGKTISIKNPFSVRDFIYVDDVIDAISKSINLNGFHIINIGTGKGTEIRYLAELMTNNNVIFEDQNGANSQSYADISKAKRLLGWEPKTDLEEGLKKIMKKE